MVWRVIYTKPRNEKKVYQRLSELGIESYSPCQKVLKRWSDRKKWVEEPIFRSYVFVKAPRNEHEKLKILSIPGVVRFLYWLGEPAKVSQIEIDAIKNFLGKHNFIDVASLDVGTQINIKSGPLKGSQGVVVHESKTEVTLQLNKLGMILTGRLSKLDVEKINL